MATLIFTAIGTVIGGPVGGLVGSLIGQQVDPLIFGAGPRREGPRLRELAVQTSSYGAQIPAIFGAMRVAGSVIWSTDLIERRSTSSGGKNRPSTVSYSYSVSMAIALSSRPLVRIGRIWAEGNLLRGAQGDFKVVTGFRFHAGHSDQPVDPLIASVESVAKCPAYRGMSYVVFENLQLADFGNRIPSLTFELFERDGSVLLSEIFFDASNGTISGDLPEPIAGYALQGVDARAALQPLVDAYAVRMRPEQAKLKLVAGEDARIYPGNLDPIVSVNGQAVEAAVESRAPDYRHPRSVALRYYDRARDYQPGLQRAGASASGQTGLQVDLPAALETAEASRVVHRLALGQDAARDQLRIAVGLGTEPAKIAQMLQHSAMRITAVEHFASHSILRCERAPTPAAYGVTSPDAGRHRPPPDLAAGQTLLALVELPTTGVQAATAPVIAIAAGGNATGWRRAMVYRKLGDQLSELGAVTAPSAIGMATQPLASHPANLVDTDNIIHVRVDTNAMPPDSVSGSPLSPDAPTLMLGDELISYGGIEPLGGNLYQIRHLLRDRAGTGCVGHQAGARAVFLDRERLVFSDCTSMAAGTELAITAAGLGDEDPVAAQLVVRGIAQRPRPPVHGHAVLESDGALRIEWIWRSRLDSGWLDGVDMPLAERQLAFEVAIAGPGGALLRTDVYEGRHLVAAEIVRGWNLPAGSLLAIKVRQIGDFALSLPLELRIEL